MKLFKNQLKNVILTAAKNLIVEPLLYVRFFTSFRMKSFVIFKQPLKREPYLIGILFIIILALSACDGGLAPPDKSIAGGKSYLSGTITYKGGTTEWPPADSVYGIRVVAFKTYPPKDIITEVISGNAYLKFESLPMFVASSTFSLEIGDPPVDLKYIVVAQQYDTLVTSQRAIGVYTTSGDNTKPSDISIEPGRNYIININVDFNSLPPQPFDTLK